MDIFFFHEVLFRAISLVILRVTKSLFDASKKVFLVKFYMFWIILIFLLMFGFLSLLFFDMVPNIKKKGGPLDQHLLLINMKEKLLIDN